MPEGLGQLRFSLHDVIIAEYMKSFKNRLVQKSLCMRWRISVSIPTVLYQVHDPIQVFNDLVESHVMHLDVVLDYNLTKQQVIEVNESEVTRLLAETEKQNEPTRCVITLALAYGLRRSEICGLCWCDVDFTNGVIHIRNTRTEYSGLVYEAEATKTKASRRTLRWSAAP